jgi:hypothetical protein
VSDLNRGGLWCPSCGDEYNIGADDEVTDRATNAEQYR